MALREICEVLVEEGEVEYRRLEGILNVGRFFSVSQLPDY